MSEYIPECGLVAKGTVWTPPPIEQSTGSFPRESPGLFIVYLSVVTCPRILYLTPVGHMSLFQGVEDLTIESFVPRLSIDSQSTIITSNKSFVDWQELFGNAVIASAIIDRLLHHSRVINIKGHSYRLREHAISGSSVPNKDAVSTAQP